MRTKIASLHFKASDSLKEFAEQEVQRLAKFSDDIISCDIEFTYTKAQKEAHVHINVDGTMLNALGASDEFQKSTVLAVDKLEQQLKKLKGKLQSKRAASNGE
jgi:ribosomal subunit interface protein